MGFDTTEGDTSPEGVAEGELPESMVPTEELPDDVRDGDASEGQDDTPEEPA
jgi:hypothetical protein